VRIEDYGLIGDTQTTALVGLDGSIDWFCAPRFDSAACFAALLGDERHGRWRLAPAGGLRSTSRRYLEDSLVLETTFDTDDGTVKVTDCMPIRARSVDIVRTVEGVSGAVPIRMDLTVRFDYGSIVPWVRQVDGDMRAVAGPDAVVLRTPAPLRGAGLETVSDFVIGPGEKVPFVLAWHPSHETPPRAVDAARATAATTRWWRRWARQSTYRGEWRDLVMRSLITLKALTYAPTGGIVAAPTTSLPEWIGSVRNWDYRYCWLRDATFTLIALIQAGYLDEARSWRDWLVRAVAGSPEDLQIMYGPAGERRLTEFEVEWLPGYEESAPVRVGNAASEQFQLDVYGEVFDANFHAVQAGGDLNPDLLNIQVELLEWLEGAWLRADDGIWEVRGPRQHFVHSKVMAWVAFDRAVHACDQWGVHNDQADRWRRQRHEIHQQVCAEGYDAEKQAFVQAYGSKRLDAAVLMMPLVGFLPATDERVRRTVEAVQRELTHEGFVARYDTSGVDDGLPPGEGVFLPCSFWLADNLTLMGRRDEARELFERLVATTNDVGLMAEEYDPVAGRQLGNFPQAFTHISLVNSAANLSLAERSPAQRRARHAGT
jgi:GH15 family glucan-1,4-alpha-glucosidase